LLEIKLEEEKERIEGSIQDPAERERKFEQTRQQWRAAVDRGDALPVLLAAIRGPVSVNPVNMFDGLLGGGIWPLGTPQSNWASFNAGELIWPQSRMSVVPYLLIMLGGGIWLWRKLGSGEI